MKKLKSSIIYSLLVLRFALSITHNHICVDDPVSATMNLGISYTQPFGENPFILSLFGKVDYEFSYCSSFGLGLLVSGFAGQSTSQFKNRAVNKFLQPKSKYGQTGEAQRVGTDILKDKGMKIDGILFLMSLSKNFCLHEDDISYIKDTNKCLCDHVNIGVTSGISVERFGNKATVLNESFDKLKNAWDHSTARDVLIGFHGSANTMYDELRVIFAIDIVAQIFARTRVYGYAESATPPSAPSTTPALVVLNYIDLDRYIRPIVIAELKIFKFVNNGFTYGISPFIRWNFREFEDNKYKLDPVPAVNNSVSNIGEMLEYNFVFGLSGSIAYIN